MAEGAAQGKVRILAEEVLIDEKPEIERLRLNWRRRPGSTLPLTGGDFGDLAELFQKIPVGMTVDTPALTCRLEVG